MACVKILTSLAFGPQSEEHGGLLDGLLETYLGDPSAGARWKEWGALWRCKKLWEQPGQALSLPHHCVKGAVAQVHFTLQAAAAMYAAHPNGPAINLAATEPDLDLSPHHVEGHIIHIGGRQLDLPHQPPASCRQRICSSHGSARRPGVIVLWQLHKAVWW